MVVIGSGREEKEVKIFLESPFWMERIFEGGAGLGGLKLCILSYVLGPV